MSDDRKDGIRAISVSPELWHSDPATVAKFLERAMLKQPAAVWLIAIGEGDPAARLMDQWFMYGPAEEPFTDEDLPDRVQIVSAETPE